MVEELQYQTLVGRARILTQCFFLRVWNQAWFTISNISSKFISHVWCPPSQTRPPDAQWSKLYQKSLILTYIFSYVNYSVSLHQHTLNQLNPYFSVLFHLKQQPSPFSLEAFVGVYRSFKRVPLTSSPWRSWRRMSWTRRWVVWSLPSPPERTSGNPAWSWTPTKRPCHLALGVIWVYTYYNIIYNIMQHAYIYMIYDWIMAWSLDITMCIYNIIYIDVGIYTYIYTHFRHMITTSAVLVESFNLSPWFAIAWHSLCLFKSGPVTPTSSIYYHLDYGISSKTNLCW